MMSATTMTALTAMTWICDDCGKRFGAAQASSSYEATRCTPCHTAHVANVYRAYDQRLSAFGDQDEPDDGEPLSDDARAEVEADALAAWNQALDERAFHVAEAARLEILGMQRLAGYDVTQEPF